MSENRKDQKGINRTDDLSNESRVNEQQDASASRGGTTDMDNERGRTGNRSGANSGSGIRTKRTVTGSDYDGQVAEE